DTGKKIYEHTAIEVDRLPLANGGDEIHIDVRGRARIASFSIADNTLAGDNDALPGAIFGQGSGIVLRSASTSAGDITLRGTIARNSLADVGNDAADVGIAITLAASSRAVLAVTDNTIDGQAGRAIAIALLDDASADLTVDGNDLGKVEGNDKVAAAMPMPPPLLGLTILCADDSILCVDLNTNDTAQGIDIREADAGRIDFGGFSFVGVYTDVIAEGELENLNTTPAMGVTVVAGDDASNCTPQSP
ncbi:MAG: hypothetical protein P1V36_16770, partial [Planctomycetota bacterium]|nr:hypothetical protein [Planctomycetota bacterium]